MNVREGNLGDIPAFFDHMMRHFAESGRDGDLLFHPVLDFENWKKEEKVAGMLKSWLLPLEEMGWQRSWIAEVGGEIVADVMLMSATTPAALHRCQMGIGVERMARGQGLGWRLSRQAIAWARMQPSLEWLDLWVFAQNAPAIALYQKLGFQSLGNVPDQFRVQGQRVDDIHMTLRLKP